MTYAPLTPSQDALLFDLLAARENGELASDAFQIVDVSTFGGNAVIVTAGNTNKDISDRGLSDFLPLRDGGYISLESVREPSPFGREDRMYWHGAILDAAWRYRHWRKLPGWRRSIANLSAKLTAGSAWVFALVIGILIGNWTNAYLWPALSRVLESWGE